MMRLRRIKKNAGKLVTQPKLLRKCWAASLGGCSSKISKEHIISAAALGKFVRFGTSMDRLKEIGKGSATVSILCTTHNSALSELDSEAAALVNAVKRYRVTALDDLMVSRGAPSEICVDVDGPKLERWAVKTFINTTATLLGSDRGPSPFVLEPGKVADFVFGKSPVCPDGGLFWLDRGVDLPFSSKSGISNFCAATVGDPIDVLCNDGILQASYIFPVYLYIGIGAFEFAVRANITNMDHREWYRMATDISCGRALLNSQFRPREVSCRLSVCKDHSDRTYTHLKLRFKW